MVVMKRILGFVLVIFVFGFGIAYFVDASIASTVNDALTISACDRPQSYKIGSIDDRFGIEKDGLLKSVQIAAGKWSDEQGKDLFVYDPDNGDLTINLVYDDRQALTSQIGDLHDKLQTEKDNIDPQIAEFEKRVQDFKGRIASLNEKISYWNSRGGAPEGEFDKLYSEQQALKSEQADLDAMAERLNRSTNEYNTQVGELNKTVNTFNSAIKVRPEEGLYNGKDNTITIYFMADSKELLHTLTHEFGHALGIDHLSNPNAIMYYQTNNQLDLVQEDKKALAFACRDRNVIDIATERIKYINKMVVKEFQEMNLIPG